MAQGPTGGAKDENPPVCVGSKPAFNSVDFSGNRVEVEFDEYVQIKDAYTNVVISPPTKYPFTSKAIGKKVIVEWKDTLKENSTYVIDFANSVADNNESNVYENFYFSFSTGSALDTLAVSGVVISAENLAPVEGVYVGAHKVLSDSAFLSFPFDKISKTDADGRFVIRGLSAVPYRLYALDDMNRNYRFDQKAEGIALLDTVVVPSVVFGQKSDTIYKDSVNIDTIKQSRTVSFKPDDIVMFFYEEKINRQMFKKAERVSLNSFMLYFNNDRRVCPDIRPLNFSSDNWCVVEQFVTADTVKVWLRDSVVMKMDTLRFAMDYVKTDSAGEYVKSTDTIQVLNKKFKKEKRRKDDDEVYAEANISSKIDIDKSPVVEWNTPVISFSNENVVVEEKVDTLWKQVNDFSVRQDTTGMLRSYYVYGNWNGGSTYRIVIDSAKVTDIYGCVNDRIEAKFSVRSKDEYANVSLLVKGLTNGGFVELLKPDDKVVRKEKINANGKAVIKNVAPGEYYLRAVNDINDNFSWDTGCFREGKKPEQVYYFDKKLKLRANWDFEEIWDVTAKPVTEQRPTDMSNNRKKK